VFRAGNPSKIMSAGCGVKVSIQQDKMRSFPIWVAVVATATVLGSTTSASGQTSALNERTARLQADSQGFAAQQPATPEPIKLAKSRSQISVSPEAIPTPDLETFPNLLAQNPVFPADQPQTLPLFEANPSSIEVAPTAPPAPTPSVPGQIPSPTETPSSAPPSLPNLNPQLDPPTASPAAPQVPGAEAPTGAPSPDPVSPDGQAPALPTAPPSSPEPGGLQVPAPGSTPPGELTPPAPGAIPTPEVPSGAEGQPTPPAADAEAEARVLVAEVAVEGVDDTALRDQVYQAISTRPGRTATRAQLQADVNAIFATGFFARARVEPSDTPLGVRVAFIVQANPVLKQVQTTGSKVLPAADVEKIFSPQYGKVLNFRDLQEGIKQVNKWYQDKGYVLAQVVGAPQIGEDGVATLEIAEGVIEDIKVRFVSKEGEETTEKGKPVKGRTKPYVILREVELKPGAVFNRNTMQADLQRIFGLGIFEDVKVALSPGEDPRQAVVTLNVAERRSGTIAAGAGFSSESGLLGTVSFQQQNLRGRNQKFGAELQLGERDLLFDLSFTDPWIKSAQRRTSYTFNIFRRRSISLVFNGDDTDIDLPNEDRPRVVRIGTGLTFTRPFSKNPFRRSTWTASLGLQYQRVAIEDQDGDLSPFSENGDLLSFSSSGEDDLLSVQFGVVRDRRDNPQLPTKGSLFRVGTEQTVPVGSGGIVFNRLRTSYTYYIPVKLFGSRKPKPVVPTKPGERPPRPKYQGLVLNAQAGGVVGDLPPYEAFALGGTNSVRGYAEGELGAGRYFVQATAEYNFPLFRIVNGALFVDAASDLGSGDSVPGNPAGRRELPGSGFGIGAGVRIDSPLGPIRLDYGVNDSGDGRFHFGIGRRF
jgi:outer membrane protein insertion porin family